MSRPGWMQLLLFRVRGRWVIDRLLPLLSVPLKNARALDDSTNYPKTPAAALACPSGICVWLSICDPRTKMTTFGYSSL